MITAETVERLSHVKTDGLPVVSAYIGYPVQEASGRATQAKVSNVLRDIRRLADDGSLSREARLSLRGDVEQIEGALAEGRWPRGTVVVFSSSRSGLFEVLRLPRPLRDRLVVDTTPWMRPMLAVLEEYHRACVVVVDRANAHMWEYFQQELVEIDSARDPVLRQHNYAGWHGFEEKRVTARAGELERKHYRRVAARLADLLVSGPFDVAIVGGHTDEISHFVDELPPEVRGRVAGSFAIDPHSMTAGEVMQAADAIVERYERDQERSLVADVFSRATPGGYATVGVASSLWAGSVLAIQQLVVQDDATIAGVVCDRCGWMGLAGEECPISGDRTRESPDIIEVLTESVIDNSGSVEHVLADTPLREQTLAAALRFPLPPQPISESHVTST